ncbi:hypothetical protein [Tenuifilum osseticum]|uniref:hypothetical protein n=1 Tax=Tenuifilum osseticum TaxID=3374723 RepID=UPI0034E545B1
MASEMLMLPHGLALPNSLWSVANPRERGGTGCSRTLLLNTMLFVFLFVIRFFAFGNGVINAGITNARIADARERGLINDLGNEKLGEFANLQWVFKKTDGITDDVLKDKVIGALESKAGKEALKQVPLQKVIEFTKLKNLSEVSKVQALINHFKDVNNFKTVFKVVEQ